MPTWDYKQTFSLYRNSNGFALRVVAKIIDKDFFYYKLTNYQKFFIKQIQTGAEKF